MDKLKKVSVSVPAKIHLLGEHTVVYGKPAILVTVGLYTSIHISKRSDSIITISSSVFTQRVNCTISECMNKVKKYRQLWNQFSATNDTSILRSIIKTPEDYTLACAGETLLYYNEHVTGGYDITIESSVPIGSGLGSSAVIGAGIAGALTICIGKKFDLSVINDIAYSCEKLRHGFPSGGDSATVIYGGLLWFRKETPDLRIIQPLSFAIPTTLSSKFLLIDTGKPVESTGEMVSSVRTLYQKDKKKVELILRDQEELVRELVTVLKSGDTGRFIDIIKTGEKNLDRLGLVSPFSRNIIQSIESLGGAAKICGGGGKTKGTGIVLAFHSDNAKLINHMKSMKLPYFTTKLGVEGIRVEQ